MLFLGSKTFPDPNLFQDHLINFMGENNAFTEDERTTFYFDINWQGFEKALHMFSRIFAEPLFDIRYTSKEIDAVNSENENNFNNDDWRELQLIKFLANKNHPFSRFSTGNFKTLKDNINIEVLHKKLFSFYNKYYVPENMRLVISCKYIF
jgi:insulysin